MNPTGTDMGSIEDLNTMKQKHTINIPSTSRFMPPPPPPPPQPKLPRADLLNGSREVYFNIRLPLYQASICGNWAAAKDILDERPELVRFAITESYNTVLHVAASAEETKLTEDFLKNLVDMMTREDLQLQNRDSNTALCLAAVVGNVKMATVMVNKNLNLLDIPGNHQMVPLYMSALHGSRNTVKYLYYASWKMTGNWWRDQHRGLFLLRCLECDLFDVALEIVKDHPKLTMNGYVLEALARKPDAVNRVEQNLMWRIINSIFRSIRMKVGPAEEDSDALELLRIILRLSIRRMPKDEVADILRGPPTVLTDGELQNSLFVAAEMGNTRFVVELLQDYPHLIWQRNDDRRTIFHIAVMHRHQDIHKLLYEIGSTKDMITLLRDKDGNNMLHLVGITSVKMRSQTSESSMIMQRELLWFKEVEKMLPRRMRENKNNDGQTPYELFSKENKDIVFQGLKWMKDCMVVATLIVTVTFAVAFTVPGAYDQNNGFPIFIHERTFLVFVIADAISLFSSSTSLLVFLSILTSRYGQRDFLYSLPRKLMIGLITLFISVAAMMVTFSASFFVLYRNRLKWVPILIATFVAMPVIVFAVLQIPLLADVFRSMCDARYLFKPRKRMLYNTNPRF